VVGDHLGLGQAQPARDRGEIGAVVEHRQDDQPTGLGRGRPGRDRPQAGLDLIGRGRLRVEVDRGRSVREHEVDHPGDPHAPDGRGPCARLGLGVESGQERAIPER
jgi:hypothetical protein